MRKIHPARTNKRCMKINLNQKNIYKNKRKKKRKEKK